MCLLQFAIKMCIFVFGIGIVVSVAAHCIQHTCGFIYICLRNERGVGGAVQCGLRKIGYPMRRGTERRGADIDFLPAARHGASNYSFSAARTAILGAALIPSLYAAHLRTALMKFLNGVLIEPPCALYTMHPNIYRSSATCFVFV